MPVNDSIWDPIIRVFHWTVAFAFLLNFFFLEEGAEPHELAGYYILCAVAVRFVWGFIGTKSARFSSFFPSISGIKQHIQAVRSGNIPEEEGHNPVGALMVFALLLGLIVTGLSGWSLEGIFLGEDWAEELHEVAANTTFALVITHVFAVVLFSIVGPRNLIVQMVSGRISK
ncbi:hypothetical protein MAQ5080_02498 [Marinomonas aquimarina]|uniref:Cytochrome b561 bacterial/Ni-hydrogenase domain-containing protein n=1 Tax=Marinomonas aquimarina TaxID=295068 RepID=A0A1A8TJW2_9GAMM|nr:cytochrome b/b6 domain-containing protein [Marinomonas aquimarina]SBS33167.1 hypothetical protein MAQ5080_02498 [Marinomonas aquimarina]